MRVFPARGWRISDGCSNQSCGGDRDVDDHCDGQRWRAVAVACLPESGNPQPARSCAPSRLRYPLSPTDVSGATPQLCWSPTPPRWTPAALGLPSG